MTDTEVREAAQAQVSPGRRPKRAPSPGTALNRMLCWNPASDQVALVPWPDHAGRSMAYEMTGLACYVFVHDMTFEQRKTLVFIEAMHLIIRDQCDPQAVHTTLLGLEEYRDGCATDMPGLLEAVQSAQRSCAEDR